LFTAAQPGQRGQGHINCQPKNYWLWHFQTRGLTLQHFETKQLSALWLEQAPRAPWYGRNLQVFAWA
jgi:hypothetical protein